MRRIPKPWLLAILLVTGFAAGILAQEIITLWQGEIGNITGMVQHAPYPEGTVIPFGTLDVGSLECGQTYTFHTNFTIDNLTTTSNLIIELETPVPPGWSGIVDYNITFETPAGTASITPDNQIVGISIDPPGANINVTIVLTTGGVCYESGWVSEPINMVLNGTLEAPV